MITDGSNTAYHMPITLPCQSVAADLIDRQTQQIVAIGVDPRIMLVAAIDLPATPSPIEAHQRSTHRRHMTRRYVAINHGPDFWASVLAQRDGLRRIVAWWKAEDFAKSTDPKIWSASYLLHRRFTPQNNLHIDGTRVVPILIPGLCNYTLHNT